ncbi:MAG: hypothetical protein ABIQ56_02755 [Chitinophagaceae bacterium]
MSTEIFYQEKIRPANTPHPLLLRLPAQLLSIIFHPLFIPVYFVAYLLYVDTYFFTGYDKREKLWVLIRVANNMVVFPMLVVLLLKGLGFIKSIFLKTQQERIIPYIASGIFFFWMYLVFRNDFRIPGILVSFTFGVFISSSVALIANIYYKISMHAIGSGGLAGVLFVILYTQPQAFIAIPLMITVFITGIICTSRLIVSNHSNKEIYMGLLVGLVCQFVAGWFIL